MKKLFESRWFRISFILVSGIIFFEGIGWLIETRDHTLKFIAGILMMTLFLGLNIFFFWPSKEDGERTEKKIKKFLSD